VNLLLISDTHVPSRAKDLPAAVWAAAEWADVVVHAGDWVDLATLDALSARSRRVVGVAGNNDGPELQARLPEVAHVRLEGLRLSVIHDSGPASGRAQRMAAAFPDTDVLVFGHSHIPWDTTAPGGPRLLNPGSPTDRRRQPYCTFMTATVRGGLLSALTLHRLPRISPSR
jgi:putative phosphoesterase